MKRQALDTGGWVDLARCTRFCEATYFDGNNEISQATGSQWKHETLYRSHSCRYVLHRWSQWQGSSQTWRESDAAEAAQWLVTHGYADGELADLGADDLADQIAQLEV